SIVSRLTPACQYGSRPEFAIIVDRHDAPIETSSPLGVVSTLWQATQFSDGVKSDSACGLVAAGTGLVPGSGGACCARGTATKNASSQMIEASGRMRVIDMLASVPVLEQAAVEPVPEEVSEKLRMPPVARGCG